MASPRKRSSASTPRSKRIRSAVPTTSCALVRLAFFRSEANPERAKQIDADLQRAVELDPGLGSALLLRGDLAFQDGRMDDALASYRAASELPAFALDGFLRVGRIDEEAGRLDAAIQSYRQALQADPESPEAMNNLAWLLGSAETASPTQLDRALELAQDAKGRLPDNPSVADTLGFVMFRKGLFDGAISQFREALGRLPAGSLEGAQTRYHLALALESKGDTQPAVRELERLLQDAPDFARQRGVTDRLEQLRQASPGTGE